MRKAMEETLYVAHVDAVFAGHVHAYERFVSSLFVRFNFCYCCKNSQHVKIYMGNREGLVKKYIDPQLSISLFREASFGHGQLQVSNDTHALWSWYRNDDDEVVVVDSVWIISLLSNLASEKKELNKEKDILLFV
ncbi:putative purple acid phosphatase 20 [Dendrobium catenatum]|uniref:Putative purple acid phosphatase 20 n=1 Tax=Dendrobium catenatum TaxID=906689 RepID=A0A2I0VD50_9ASPA|nr:putative purple acid phosphatase 20 [Dendrobium catenatum]